MHLIRIEIIDKKYTLISTIEIKNALELMMGGVGGGGGEEEIRIKTGRITHVKQINSFDTH